MTASSGRAAIGAHKTVALALGAGAARGLSHIAALEALDEMGVKPVAIAGTSMGAAIGAAYAAGLSGKAIRRAVIQFAHDRAETFGRLFAARVGRISELWTTGFSNPMLVDAEKLCAAFLPAEIPDDFAKLSIPLTVIATDLYGRCEVAFNSGALKPALAASMAIPGLVRPVELDGRVLVDGGAVNPLPFDHLRERADVIVAIDSSAEPVDNKGVPPPWDCLFATLQVMTHTIVGEKLRHGAPDILLRPNVGIFRMLDFFQTSAILRSAEPIKTELKSRLAELFERA